MQDKNDFVQLLSKTFQILCAFIRSTRYWKSNNKVKSWTKVADEFTTIGQRKDDTEEKMKGRLFFLGEPLI